MSRNIAPQSRKFYSRLYRGRGMNYFTSFWPETTQLASKGALREGVQGYVKICLVLHIPFRNIIIVKYSDASEDGGKQTRVHYRILRI